MKLFIMAAVLDMDSKEKIQMNTIVACDGLISEGKLRGSLYLKGSGNAFLSERDMESAAEEIFSRGIKEITGNIIADDSLFDIKGWNSYYQGPAYASPGSLGMDLHTINVFGRPPNIKVEPVNDDVKVSFVPDRKPSIRQIDDLTYEVRGEISDSGFLKKRFALQDPATYSALTFKTLLREKGINVKGTVRRGETPPHAAEIFSIKAKDLREIVKDTNNNSLNVIAENLLLLIGAKRFGAPGTIQKGIKAVYEFMSEIDLPPGEVSLADGSGLSHDNRITTEQMVGFLKKVSEKPWFKTFYESLPRAGIDGTLKDIGYKNEHVRAKTGQLKDVYCVAGYVERKNGGKIAFSYMVNVPGAELLRKDAIGLLLARLADEGS
jgi:D-alanyl-D-alanine carboxypeptidase/D-alanyl-D-alanine-endopeptidase (penicillin-binding protein 4)